MYADDNSARYPSYAAEENLTNSNAKWWFLLRQYDQLAWTNSRYHCPGYNGIISETNDFSNPYGISYGSYSFNFFIQNVPEQKLLMPSECITVTDSRSVFASGQYRGLDGEQWIYALDNLQAKTVGFQSPRQHGQTFNVLYCDGHVAAFKVPDLFDLSMTGASLAYDHQVHDWETWIP